MLLIYSEILSASTSFKKSADSNIEPPELALLADSSPMGAPLEKCLYEYIDENNKFWLKYTV